MSRERQLADLDRARFRYASAVERCRGRFGEPVAPGRWTVGDLVRHVSAWDDAGAEGVVALAEGRPPDVYADDIDAWNGAAVAGRATLDETALLVDLAGTRRRLHQALIDAPARLWGAPPVASPHGEPVTIEGIVEVWRDHDEEHAAELEAFLGRGHGPGSVA